MHLRTRTFLRFGHARVPFPFSFLILSFFLSSFLSLSWFVDVNRRLSRRPSLEDLQQKNILPGKDALHFNFFYPTPALHTRTRTPHVYTHARTHTCMYAVLYYTILSVVLLAVFADNRWPALSSHTLCS